jgi:hypothetical protein
MSELSSVENLAARFDKACETIFSAAVKNQDIDSAVVIAKTALSTAVQLSSNLSDPPYQQSALLWFERLSSLYVDQSSMPTDIARTLEWAGSRINTMLKSLQDRALGNGPRT